MITIRNNNRNQLLSMVVMLCLFFVTPQAKASNYGYIWFSTGNGYLDELNAVDDEMKKVPIFSGPFPEVNSVVEIKYDVPIYSFDVIEKISQHYDVLSDGRKQPGCEKEINTKAGLTVYMISSLDNKDCTIKALKLKERKDYFMLTSRKIRVLGYVIFKNINFMLVESVK